MVRASRLAATAMIGLLAAIASVSGALADVRMVLTTSFYEHEIYPGDIVHTDPRTFEVTVTSDHHVKIASLVNGQLSNAGAVDEVLDKPSQSTTNTGRDYVIRVRTENGAIIIAKFYPSYSSILRITINGNTSCAVTSQFKLASGHSYFEVRRLSDHGELHLSEMRYDNLSCSISTL